MDQSTSSDVVGVLDWEIELVNSTSGIRAGRTTIKPGDIDVRTPWRDYPDVPPISWMRSLVRSCGVAPNFVARKTVELDRDFSLSLLAEATLREADVKWLRLEVRRGPASEPRGKFFWVDRPGR